ncbi:MAG: hypothetical protein ACO1PB_06140 [Ramlibacter sp.]
MTQDFRFAARMLWRNRGFAASAMLILTLGIAASTGLFAVIDAVVLHPLPYAGADRIARVRLRSGQQVQQDQETRRMPKEHPHFL